MAPHALLGLAPAIFRSSSTASASCALAALLVATGLLLAAGCAGSPQRSSSKPSTEPGEASNGSAAPDTSFALSEAQAAKLDAALKQLLNVSGAAQGTFRYSVAERPDGAKAYAVLLSTSATREALREAGVPVEVVAGGTATTSLTRTQIAQAARLETVQSIRNSPPDRKPLGE